MVPFLRIVRLMMTICKVDEIWLRLSCSFSVIKKDRKTQQPRGFGFVTYADPSVVDTVIEETHVINGKQVEIKRTIPRGAMGSKKIFVGGIPTTVNEDEFSDFFSQFGEVKEHQIMRDHSTGRSRGFRFVTFETEQAVDNLLDKGNKLEFAGAQAEIKKAEPKKQTTLPPPPSKRYNDSRPVYGGGYGDSYGGYGGGAGAYRSTASAYAGRGTAYGGYSGSEFGGYGVYGGGAGGCIGAYRGEPSVGGYAGRYGGAYSRGYDLGGGGGYGGTCGESSGGYGSAGGGAGGGYGSGSGYDAGFGGGYGGGSGASFYGSSRGGYGGAGSGRYHPYGR